MSYVISKSFHSFGLQFLYLQIGRHNLLNSQFHFAQLYYPVILDSFKAPVTLHWYSCSHPIVCLFSKYN